MTMSHRAKGQRVKLCTWSSEGLTCEPCCPLPLLTMETVPRLLCLMRGTFSWSKKRAWSPYSLLSNTQHVHVKVEQQPPGGLWRGWRTLTCRRTLRLAPSQWGLQPAG